MAEASAEIPAKRVNGVSSSSTNALDPYYIKFLQKSNNIDVSFSSYLKRDEQQDQEQDETELGIFDARKYFSETANVRFQKESNLNPPRLSSASSASGFNPSGHVASSEASWNSQTGLLANAPREHNRDSSKDRRGSDKKASFSGSRWLFRRRACPCSSKKSVQVQESKSRTADPKSVPPDRIVHVSINPVSLNRSSPSPAITGIHHQTISTSEPTRLTIPSNPVAIRGSISMDDAVRELRAPNGSFSFPILSPQPPSDQMINPVSNPTVPPPVITEEDAASDASSDLFEIESFSTSRACPPRADLRNSLDEATEPEAAKSFGFLNANANVVAEKAKPSVALDMKSTPFPI